MRKHAIQLKTVLMLSVCGTAIWAAITAGEPSYAPQALAISFVGWLTVGLALRFIPQKKKDGDTN